MISRMTSSAWGVSAGLFFVLLTGLFAAVLVLGDALPLWLIAAGILSAGVLAMLPSAFLRPARPAPTEPAPIETAASAPTAPKTPSRPADEVG
ncbi:hypothetical protein M3A96_07330 [Helcobacillus massiliensis]|uniref:hypothetical protein n=1 Tax=Helcobacillus massiliensis TaxID=521392 RepID=UPI0021A2A441|nr:hypothetical protein [Helcobacillus massiliensis]MCT1557926.1 hypothetical protein [Helcobacillus massiliensis]MCT2036550.1 hypothetical protein [Helcobacillus massiliensis]MCT2332549.1 hypothetical protein [Helcobacillus massiliensis]